MGGSYKLKCEGSWIRLDLNFPFDVGSHLERLTKRPSMEWLPADTMKAQVDLKSNAFRGCSFEKMKKIIRRKFEALFCICSFT